MLYVQNLIVLFTCSNSCGICLGIIPECASESCINVIKRFISLRGATKVITSDNGS